MTVPSEVFKNIYTCNGSQTVFPYTFRIFADANLEVILYTIADGTETTLTLTTHYTVSDAGEASGGNVTTVSTYSSDYKLIIRRNLAYTQETNFVENDPSSAETSEDSIDRLTMLTQQLKEVVDRGIVQDSSATTEIEFPGAVASKIIGWNSGGTGLQNYTPSEAGIETLQAAFDGGQTITIADGDNQTLAITNNDTTNNPNTLTITNAGDGYSLQISHTGTNDAIWLNQDAAPAAGKHALFIVSGQDTTDADTALVKLSRTGGSATEPMLEIVNASGGAPAIEVSDGDIRNVAWTDYTATSTITGWSSTTFSKIHYKKVGNLVFFNYQISGTSNSTGTSFTLPYTSANVTAGYTWSHNLAVSEDNGGVVAGRGQIGNNTATVTLYPTTASAGATWTSSGAKNVAGQGWYEANT